MFTVASGFYLRELREVSVTSPDIVMLVCQFLTVTRDPTITIAFQEIHYIDGNDCLNVTGSDPVLMHSFITSGVESLSVSLSLPLSDDTRSDLLGAFDLDPTDDTAERY